MSHSKQLLLLVAATMCAVVATSGAASAAKFTSTVTKDTVVGSGGEQIFSVGTVALKCASITGSTGATTFPTEQLVLSMKFEKCSVTGLGTATFVCAAWNFHSTGTVSGGVDTGGTVTTGECKIEVVGGICKIVIPSQLATGVTYTNSSGSILLKLAIFGLKYTASAGCIGFEKEGKNAGMSGSWTLKGAGKLEIV